MAKASDRVGKLNANGLRLEAALTGLKESPAYTEGIQLKELRDRVHDLMVAVDRARHVVAERATARSTARRELEVAARTAEGDHRTFASRLRDLGDHVVEGGLPLGGPDVPALSSMPLEAGTDLAAPTGELDVDGVRRRFEDLRGAVVHRRGDLADVRKELAAVDEAERRLCHAVELLEAASADSDGKRETSAHCRHRLDEAVATWRRELVDWDRLLREHRTAFGLIPGVPLDLETDLVRRQGELFEAMAAAADEVVARHLEALTALEVRRGYEQAEADERGREVAALAAIVVPAPPAQGWQRQAREASLAELIDFREEVVPASEPGSKRPWRRRDCLVAR